MGSSEPFIKQEPILGEKRKTRGYHPKYCEDKFEV